jgi:putative Ca2+/H+ antiporter (TMEM165/GDT1 family)
VTSYLEIVVVAFVAQLVVLPGEKAQFVIAGLATRYNPLVVVVAATVSFASWTALEIWLGSALRAALSPLVLDSITAALFVAFAVVLFRSAPDPGGTRRSTETDGGFGTLSRRVDLPDPIQRLSGTFGGFVPAFTVLAAGEFGDKTQLVTIGLAAQYGATSAIWVGEMLAIVPVSLANAYFFHAFAHRIDMRKVHLFSGALFLFFGLDTVLSIVTGFSVWEAFVATVSAAVTGLF